MENKETYQKDEIKTISFFLANRMEQKSVKSWDISKLWEDFIKYLV